MTFKEYPKMLYRDGEHLVVADDAHAAVAAVAGWRAVEELDAPLGETRPHAATAPDPVPYVPPEPSEMDRKALLAELTGGFAAFLNGRTDEQLRDQLTELRARRAEAAEAPADHPPADAYPNLSPAQEKALDRIPGDGVIKPGGAPKGGNRSKPIL